MPTFYDRGGSGGFVTLGGDNRGGSITTGGTAQVLAAANPMRQRIEGQNISAEDLWINDQGGTAAADTPGSWKVPAGETFYSDRSGAISIVGATTGSEFTAYER